MADEIEVIVDDSGRPRKFIIHSDDPEVKAEIKAFIKMLKANDEIAPSLEAATSKHTHYLAKRKDGRVFLKRRGFS